MSGAAMMRHAMIRPAVAPSPAREMKFTGAGLSPVEADGTFSGYASLFDRVDLGRDRVLPGAFAKSLAARGAGGIRMLWQHDPAEPIGAWLSIREDAKGLFVTGRLELQVAKAREALALMRQGALDGLSIGFRTAKARTDRKSGIRDLIEVDLWEISIVTFPMLPEARVARVKAAVMVPLRDGWKSGSPALRARIAGLGVELAALRLNHALAHLKYDPNQPRVPAGNPDGGQWSDVGGGRATASAADHQSGKPAAIQPHKPSAITREAEDESEVTKPAFILVAQNDRTAGYPVDLNEEAKLGGHAMAHVGRSQQSLLADVRAMADIASNENGFANGLREGTFTSLEAANKLVNATIAKNGWKISQVINGESSKEELDADFETPTGYEAYARTERSQPYIRNTYGVRVVVVPDGVSAKKYRIDTAFPRNSY